MLAAASQQGPLWANTDNDVCLGLDYWGLF